MSFKKSRQQQNREFWRNVFIWTIGLTVPCYLLAIFTYAFAPRQSDRIPPTGEITATWTPIDPAAILTQRALTNPAPTVSPVFASSTPFDNFSTVPPDFFTSVFVTSTPAPTRFITSVPSNTPVATNTSPATAVPATPIPQPTDPIILPPTDTPNP